MKNLPEPTFGLVSGTLFNGFMLINPSREVVVSLACYSYSKSVRLGEFKSVENDYLNGDVTP